MSPSRFSKNMQIITAVRMNFATTPTDKGKA